MGTWVHVRTANVFVDSLLMNMCTWEKVDEYVSRLSLDCYNSGTLTWTKGELALKKGDFPLPTTLSFSCL